MQVIKTLIWFQKHAAGGIRANVQTVVKDDAGAVVATSAQDVDITAQPVVDAVAAAEAAVCTELGATLPAPE